MADERGSQVFISYAANSDLQFVRELAADLRAAGFRTWVDRENGPRDAKLIKEALKGAMKDSPLFVFVCSSVALERDWTRFELDWYDKHGADKVRVNVLRFEPERGEEPVPAFLDLRVHVKWLDGRDRDEAFWEVFAGLTGKEVGPEDTWAGEGRKARSGSHRAHAGERLIIERAPAQPPLMYFSSELYTLDRDEQWGNLDSLALSPQSAIIFLPGDHTRGHKLFLDRVRLKLAATRPRPIDVTWDTRDPAAHAPQSPEQLRDALARALDCSPALLKGELQRRLARQPLLLVLPKISADFLEPLANRYDAADEPPLLACFTRWLPELVAEAKPAHGIKCLQAVEWTRTSAASRALAMLAWLVAGSRAYWVRRAIGERRARSLMKRVCERLTAPPFVAHELPELSRFERRHVQQLFLRVGRKPPPDDVIDGLLQRSAGDVYLALADQWKEPS